MAATILVMMANSKTANDSYSSDLLDMICSIAQFKFNHNNFKTSNLNASNPVFQGLAMLAEEIEFLKEENQKLRHRNTILEKYNYTVAHDLKSPLMAANGIIDLLKTEPDTPLTDEQTQLLELLEETNQRGVTMISEILEYSRTTNSSFELKEVGLSAIKEEIQKIHATDKHLRINWPEILPTVFHDEMALKQVLNNLIGNSIKHSDKTVCEVTISYKFDDSYHYLSVEDNGPGIQKHKQNKVFDLFEASVCSGNCNDGIGLAIVKQIVNRRGGEIWVDPTFENGAKFTFSIPK